MATRTTKPKVAPVEEPEEDEFEEVSEDEDLDELEEVGDEEEDEEPQPKPKARKTTSAKTTVSPKFGSAELAAYITEQTGEKFDGRSVRMLLRKLAKDGKLDRVVGETRDRYSFSGPNDSTVKQVLAMVKSGEAKAMKQEGLAAVKEKAEAKRKAARAAKEAEAEDAEEVDEEEPAPKVTRTRRTAPAKTAPAKATPTKATATRRRASTSA